MKTQNTTTTLKAAFAGLASGVAAFVEGLKSFSTGRKQCSSAAFGFGGLVMPMSHQSSLPTQVWSNQSINSYEDRSKPGR